MVSNLRFKTPTQRLRWPQSPDSTLPGVAIAAKERYCQWLYSNNHDLGCFNKSCRSLPRLEPHLAGGGCCNDGSNLLFADGYLHFCHQTANAHILYTTHELIPSADATDNVLTLGSCSCSGPKQEAINLALPDSMVTSRCFHATDFLRIDPLLDCGETNPQLGRCFTRFHQIFALTVLFRRLDSHRVYRAKSYSALAALVKSG